MITCETGKVTSLILLTTARTPLLDLNKIKINGIESGGKLRQSKLYDHKIIRQDKICLKNERI